MMDLFEFIPSPEKSQNIVGGVVGAMLVVVAVTAVIGLTVYCFMGVRTEGSINL